MSDDLLGHAIRALREEGAPPADDLAETRARLLASSRTRKTRRANALRWVLPLAAAFAAGTAFAATNGGLERAVRAVHTWLVEAPVVEAPAEKAKRSGKKRPADVRAALPATAPSPSPAEAPVAAPAEVASAETPVPAVSVPAEAPAEPKRWEPRAPRRAPAEALRPSEPARTTEDIEAPAQEPRATDVAVAPANSPAQPSPDLALYREAHRSHFIARDYADALALWNAYLARFPRGIFTLEARYNRAICLVRLGRKQEAEQALSPFAAGELEGAYRQEDARALLEALRKKP